MTSGKIQLQHGAKLKAEHGLKMSGGEFQTLQNGVTARRQPHAHVEGNVAVSGGDVVILAESPNRLRAPGPDTFDHPLFFGTLWVEGEVNWTGGTYHPCVREALSGGLNADSWHSQGTFAIGGTATIRPGALNDGGTRVTPTQTDKKWSVISSDTIVTVAPNSLTVAPSPPWSWALEQTTPAKLLEVKL